MQEVKSFLMEWFVMYLENRGMFKKDLIKVEKFDQNSEFLAHYRDRIMHFLIKMDLESDVLGRLGADENFGLVTLNNPVNIRFVVNNWNKLSGFGRLSIYFINPFSNSEKVWVIKPNVHDKICDKNCLELGLKAISEMVDTTNASIMEKKVILKIQESGLQSR